jgi:hypothetical protein
MARKLALLLALGILGYVPAAIAFGSGSPVSPSSEQQCRAEQADAGFATAHGGKTFAQFYGTNGNQQNAFGKCLSSLAKVADTSSTSSASSTSSSVSTTTTTTSHVSSSQACRTERAADAAAFKAKYGTNRNHANAFGKCVSAKEKASKGKA